MKAAFCIGSGKFEIRDVPRPQPGEREALVRVRACGICGSDKSALARAQARNNIPGHELSGVVEYADPGDDVAIGQEVVVDPVLPCGECKYCKAGRTSFCMHRKGTIGYGAGGGFAEYVSVPLCCLYPKPANIDFAEASMTEPLGVAVNGANLRDATGLDCLVFGAGAIGTMLAQVLKRRGADTVYIADVDEGHLDIARQLGDFVTINARDESAWDAVKDADIKVAYDVVGGSAAVAARALSVLAERGALVFIGAQKEGAVSMATVEERALSLIQTEGVSIAEMREAVSLLGSGQVNVKPLISARFSLDDIEGAFQASLTGIKVVVEP